ncbi:hypothetical protein H8S95_05830 [Pontibacter sp. KCTC 32443]|uniref:hypothetical protein n=1 Tax=Pontibacter TaxID=323449 RepID=UPI00164D637C|nr:MULTISPECIES: hypothetical protein [Pontibacter]MBC5773576.1 hypothetical protein [Pontibacter sp. KCTC 32443]
MNEAHLHITLNHVPIIGSILGVLILAGGMFFKSRDTIRTALLILIMSAIVAIPTYLTGEAAEETVEHMEGMSHNLIHEHEEKAELYIWLIVGMGVLSAISFFADLKQMSIRKTLFIATIVLGMISIFIARQVGTSGGEINHPEIRDGFVAEEEHD